MTDREGGVVRGITSSAMSDREDERLLEKADDGENFRMDNGEDRPLITGMTLP